MADMALQLSGNADAVTELANFAPVRALRGTDFKPEDFSGGAKADIQARIGLINDQNPPKPTWNARIALEGVNLQPEMEGHKIAALTGSLDVDTQAARLSARGTIDEVPADITLTEPVDANSTVKRERIIKASLDNQQREKLVPGLSDIVNGTIVAELTRVDEKRQAVTLDLTRAVLTAPMIGWTKGSGIGAKAQFNVVTGDAKQTDIRDFQLSGDSFGARGEFQLSGGSLSTASLTRVQLSPADNYSVVVKRASGAYDVSINGESVDIRPLITRMRAGDDKGTGGSGGSGKGDSTTLRAKVDRAVGFNDEALSNVNVAFSMRGDTISRADITAVTGSGQALVSEMTRGDTISVTSGDAGAIVRFADLYDNLRGGLLNLKLKARGDDWDGAVDIRSFAINNEERLQSLVSTPVGQNGQSLNSAVKRDIDVSSARFQRAYASLVYRNGALGVANGVVRGEQIGATFQGTVRDASGAMDLTGTFMPAYGLNRLFGELPLIGAILGNGRDRGLLGITFKMQGPFDKPKLSVNPLSIIAPGVFRQIFEFQ
ncbi:AsmA-like C-terminal region-containing protein [Aliirhizobium terrae]|uniref:AsmA-like C-terminal region-containing protein n=1 Tax=Terrirhizobium terrae TaxID=2926709 RepID=UPI002578D9C9|nr:AsmA-like C-terminal region-containing protein [Rhizobium sp. CC-CFT758]WJH40094.1 AsmA-like C-terminal region-containing protein [Rhizobium sp. CC-CFT758]